LKEDSDSINPLLDVILEQVPPAASNTDLALRAQPFNLAYDNFLGRMAIARVYEGIIRTGTSVVVKKPNGEIEKGKITALFTFHGVSRKESNEAIAGDIVMLAGLPEIMIGDTICISEDQELLPSIKIDEPTITLNFLVNDSPFAGKDGKLVTSRQIRERLMRELEVNVGLQIDFAGTTNSFSVRGRGELHISILLENMRREGYEVQVSQPQVIIKEEGGKKLEPFEEVIVDVPMKDQGTVIEKLSKRAFRMLTMSQHENTVRLIFEGPTRGLLGYRGEFIVDTRGLGILSSRVIGFKPFAGEINKRPTGAMVSIETGKAAAFALWNLQERGALYIGPNTEVYEGMVIGDTSKGDAMSVNPIKGKRLTNMRASGSDEAIQLTPFIPVTIERGLEIMTDDEFLEVTPHFVRLRKQYLKENDRIKARRGKA
jgi:GTP-binding protein